MHDAILQVMWGQTYYDVGLPKEQLDKLFSQKTSKMKELLSTREQEIVRLTILGFTNQEIANQLYISVKTVENHKSNIMQKLELKTKAELVQYGLTNGYINWRKRLKSQGMPVWLWSSLVFLYGAGF